MRINVNMSDELIKKIDEKAKQMYISRSAYISMAATQKMQSDEVISSMPQILQAAEKLGKQIDEHKEATENRK